VIGLALQLAASNLVFSVALAVVAHVVDRTGRYPSVAHLLWVLVLVKVLTPPLVMLPLLPGSSVAGLDTSQPDVAGLAIERDAWTGLAEGLPLLLVAWLVGSALVLIVSIVRVRRFDALLHRTSRDAPPAVADLAAGVASRLGLRSRPLVQITSARISPLTWWTGGRVRIVVPAALCEAMDEDQLRWVLAHELGHVKRRDHLVRWLEWLACVAFWWNPAVWWARRSLRHDEEVSCDALVVARLDGRPQAYARALLAVVEFLVAPATRPPAVATGIDAGGRLERRFARIVAPDAELPMSRRLSSALLSASLVLMMLGLGTGAVPSVPSVVVLPPATLESPTSGPALGDAALSEPGTAGDERGDADGAYALLSAEVDRDAPSRSSGGASRSRASGVVRVGTRGSDRLVGTAAADRLSGGRGRDSLRGGPGADRIRGGLGADAIRGGPGDDVILGGPGLDTIHGGRGDDRIRTWQDAAADVVDCGPGSADRAIVDASDVTRGCETVVVR
jgi:beta-lactamase regulating signal transducer with metallopeptidase domain